MAVDVIKIAVKNAVSTSLEFNQSQLLSCPRSEEDLIEFIIRKCCESWTVIIPEENEITDEFSLRFDKSDELVTKENKSTITPGSVLKLCSSTSRMVQDLLDSLSTHGNTGIDNLLQRLNAGDQQFLSQLVEERNGVPIILKRVLYDLDTHEDTKIINYLLDALCHMTNMSSGVLKLVESSEDGIKLITILSQKLGIQGSADQPRVKYSATLLTLAQKSPELSSIVGKEINVQRLLELILNRENSPTVQTSTLALFNELVLNAEDRLPLIQLMEKNSLAPTLGKQFSLSNDKCSALQKRQLYYVQCWTLFKYKRMMKTSVDSQDQKAVGMIKELRKIAFERNLEQSHQPGMGTLQRNRFADDYKTLGFDSTVDPTQDFQKSPGLLALFLMHDFATRNADVFNKLVLESSCRGDECPYAMSSIGLVKVLCQVFHIDEDPLDGGSTHGQNKRPFWCPFILIREECLAKIFAICILHLFKTWREMRASMNDLDKVMDVTKEQILTALSGEPGKLEEFKELLPTYSQICDTWKDGNKKRSEEDSEAIKPLKDVIQPEILHLITMQRLNFASEGTKFTKQKKDRGKYLYIKLSPNKKMICFGDWTDHESVPEIENLEGKLPVCDIKALVTGNECLTGNNKDTRRGNKDDTDRYLTIMSDNVNLEIIAPDAKSFDYWCDAINALLRKEMVSSRMVQDLDLLTGMEIRLRLLDIEGIKLPDKAPIIPPPPPTFDFVS